jgi:hypothetical protein
MRLLYLTAGAGGMYCGSCLRDNALAAELMAEGHDVTLVPLYTPTLTDEPNVSQPRVFFGGISVYLEQHSALFRRTPKWLDRLWDSAFALRLAARRSIAVDPGRLGELTVSMLKGGAGNQRKELDNLLGWLGGQGAPDVVTLQNSMLIALAAPVKKALRRPVVCTLQGEDLFLDNLREPHRAEALRLIRENVAHVDAFIAVSEFYADYMPTTCASRAASFTSSRSASGRRTSATRGRNNPLFRPTRGRTAAGGRAISSSATSGASRRRRAYTCSRRLTVCCASAASLRARASKRRAGSARNTGLI